MRRYLLQLGLIAGLVITSPVLATDLEPPELDRYLRWGILRVRPGISITDLGYDDNVFYGDQDNTVGDYRVTVSPRVEGLLLLGSRAFVTFNEQLHYTAYLENTDQNFLNNRTLARVTVPFNRIGVFGDVAYNQAQWRPIDDQDERVEQRERRLTAGFIVHPGWRTEIEIGRSESDWSFDDEDNDSISQRLDRKETGTTLLARHHAMGRSSILVTGLRMEIDFENPPVLDPTATKNATQTRLLGGLELRPGGRIWGRIQLGWETIRGQDPRLPEFSDLVGEAMVILQLRSRTRLRLDAVQLGGFATSGLNVYYLDTHAGARIVHFLNGFFGVEAGGTTGDLTFPGSLESGPERSDSIRRYDFGIRLRLAENGLGRRVEYSLRVGRYRRDSNQDEFDQEQKTVFFGAVVGF